MIHPAASPGFCSMRFASEATLASISCCDMGALPRDPSANGARAALGDADIAAGLPMRKYNAVAITGNRIAIA
jgi:hypothetical protein